MLTGRYDSTWHADGRVIIPPLWCTPLATLHGHCHGVKSERRTSEAGNRNRFPVPVSGPPEFPK